MSAHWPLGLLERYMMSFYFPRRVSEDAKGALFWAVRWPETLPATLAYGTASWKKLPQWPSLSNKSSSLPFQCQYSSSWSLTPTKVLSNLLLSLIASLQSLQKPLCLHPSVPPHLSHSWHYSFLPLWLSQQRKSGNPSAPPTASATATLCWYHAKFSKDATKCKKKNPALCRETPSFIDCISGQCYLVDSSAEVSVLPATCSDH